MAALALIGADDTPRPQSGDEQLQGTWYITQVNRLRANAGRESLDFHDTRFTLTFDRGMVSSIGDGKILWQGTYRLNAAVNPHAIDILRQSTAFKQGIYRQDGETLTLCLDTPQHPRPTRFKLAKDATAELMVFKRLKPAS
jgi:uncharacterized protein (TIGR03067 family)